MMNGRQFSVHRSSFIVPERAGEPLPAFRVPPSVRPRPGGTTMLLPTTTTHRPATDLGYLLHKSPARAQSFPLSFGQAHVFYPHADAQRCTAALLLDVDPVGLVRNRRGPPGEG